MRVYLYWMLYLNHLRISSIQTAVVQRGRTPLTLPNQEESNADDQKLVIADDEGEAPGEYKRLPKKALVS